METVEQCGKMTANSFDGYLTKSQAGSADNKTSSAQTSLEIFRRSLKIPSIVGLTSHLSSQ